MGVNWISWGTTGPIILTLLRIQGAVSVTSATVTGVEGEPLSFRCDYGADCRGSVKYFCRVDGNASSSQLIVTKQPDQEQRMGRFSLYDNATGACVVVRVRNAAPEDSGTYWCGADVGSRPDDVTVIHLTVFPAAVKANSTVDRAVIQVNSPLFLTAVMCVAAMLFVCVFTLSLLLTIRYRRSGPSPIRQTSADYETMMPSVRNEPEPCCTCPDCVEVSASSPSPPNISSDSGCKQRESIISVGMSEYASVCVPEASGQYQCLAVSKTDDKVYHNLHGKRSVKGA